VTTDDVISAALALPLEERAKLAQELIRSLEEGHGDVEAAWAEEIARRAREVSDGTVELIDWDVARERIARRLRERREAKASSGS
jgi:putative addiction module component (TIGR02574 family)